MYQYMADVIDVYDGDTITVNVDLGMDAWLHGQKIRLYGINAPELKGASRQAGLTAKDWLTGKIAGKRVLLQTHKNNKDRDSKGKFGRWLADVYVDDMNINQELVRMGLAVPFMVDA